jgi:hypothetical protein
MQQPSNPKIYHILHHDRLPSVIRDGFLFSDAIMNRRSVSGTTIGMSTIKQRRLTELSLTSHPNLLVGQCVPFYYCSRSVMLYLLHKSNNIELAYRGRQEPIVHLELDLRAVIEAADASQKRWAITKGNAGSYYFEDSSSLDRLSELNWSAIQARQWSQGSVKEAKQSEFLVEDQVPWTLVSRIGVQNAEVQAKVQQCLATTGHRPPVEIKLDWYY